MSDTASRLPACRGDGAAHQISPRDFTNSRTGPRSWGHRHWRSSLGSVSGSSMPTAAGSVRKRPERETAFLEKSRKQFECAICLELSLPYKEPRVLPCSHVFDRACLERVVQLAEQAGTAVHSCPECAQRFSRTQIKDLQEDKFAWRTLMNLLIPCPLECSWEGDVGDLDTHFNSCEKGKCADCGAVVRPPDTLEEHAEDCPKAVLACDNEGCSVEVTRDLLDAHFEVCPHEILSCESRGCDHECKRSMMKRHMTSAKDRHLALLNELLVNHEKELASLRPVALPVKGQRHAFYDEFYVEVPPPSNDAAQLARRAIALRNFYAGPFRFRLEVMIENGQVFGGPFLADERLRWAKIRFVAHAVNPAGPRTNPNSYSAIMGSDGRGQTIKIVDQADNPFIQLRDGKRMVKLDFRLFVQDWGLAADVPAGQPPIVTRDLKKEGALTEGERWHNAPF